MEHSGPVKRVALFGGAFDPPHNGHVLIITALLNSRLVDQIWVVPVGDGRADKRTAACAAARRRMVEAMLQEFFGDGESVLINPIQLEGKLPGSYTVDLLDEMQRLHPRISFSFVIGADNLKQIPSWKSPERLFKEVRWLVMPRPGEIMPPRAPLHLKMISGPMNFQTSVSSSAVREALSKGQSLAGVVPASVLALIRAEKIYQ